MAAQFPSAIKTYTALSAGKAVPFDVVQSWQDEINALESTFINGQAQTIVYNNNTQSINSATWTTLTFDSEEIDIGSMHSTSANTSRLTIPTGAGGRYRLDAVVPFAGNTTGVRAARFFKNATTVVGSIVAIPGVNSSGVGGSVHIALIITLAAADFVEVQGFQDSGGALNVGAATGAGNRFLQAQFQAVRQW